MRSSRSTFLAGVLRSRFDRAAAARIVLSLDAGATLRDALAQALHDPSLEIVYRLDDPDGWVDADGRGVEEPLATHDRSVTMIERNGRRIAALRHDPTLADDPGTIDLVATAVGLPLENVRLQAEQRSQFKFLATLVNTAPSLFIHLDTEGRIVNQNVAAVQAAGADDEETVRGRFVWDVFVDPEERDDVIGRFRAAAPEHAAAEYESTFVNRRGERRVIFWRSAPLPDDQGRTKGIIAGGIDITARHEDAEARERERAFLNAIANEAPSLLCLIDEQGVLAPMGANKAFERALGVDPHETGGTVLWKDYVAPEEADEVRALIGRVVAGEAVGDHDSTWVTRSGTRFAVSWACIRLPSIDERRLLLVSGVDVSERKQREVQLQRERDITSTLMQAIPSIIVVVDREGMIVDSGVDEARAAVNDAFRETLGWPDDEIVNTSVLDLIDPNDGYFARMAIGSAANGVASAERETHWRTSDGDHVVVAWTATPVADVTLREESLVLLSGIDVTERKRQDEEIRASRSRIIEAADEARRVLERNLHDGAQQRLVALSVSLRLAESKTETDPAGAAAIIKAAREELAAALEELRELARGIHPAVLTDRGLAAAVEALVARTPLPVEVATPPERLPAPIEAAAYYVVAEALTNIVKYAGATAIEVSVEVGEGCVLVDRHRRRMRRRRPRHGNGPAWAARPPGGARRDAFGAQPGRRRNDDHRRDPAHVNSRVRRDNCSTLVGMSAGEGTVAFLLCDIEGSTRLVHEAGTDYATILNGVRRHLREAVSRHDGTVIDAHGDEVFAAFPSLDEAVRSAVDSQRALIDETWPGDHDVRVRMGIHVGEPLVTDEGYTGIDVHRAARIGSAGHGGQILLSSAACAPSGFAVRDLGSHRLAGLPEPEHIHQLLADGLPRDFPPLRNTIALLGNAMTVVIAEDSILLREGVVRLLVESGFDVVGQSDNADDLLRHVAMHKPAVAIVDIRMPPTHTDEGLVAAREIRGRFPETGVLVLSQYVEPGYAVGLLEDGAEGVGYLLKDRVSDLEEFASAVRRVGEGGSALDPGRRQPARRTPPGKRPPRRPHAARA